MTTHTPAQPFTASVEATRVLAPQTAQEPLDALPLLDARLLAKTIAPSLAPHGHYLCLDDGDDTRLLRVDQDITHLGRGTSADIRFDDHRVSSDHAILFRYGGRLRLLDNRSLNGTFINGRRITAANVSSGDVVELGPVRMHLVEVD